MTKTDKAVPFLAAVAIVAMILLTASSWITPSRADATWYSQLTENERAFYLIGYLTANTVWSNAIYEADEIEPITDPVKHVYRLLMPASSYTWHELDNAIMSHVGRDTPVWQLIHSYANTSKDEGGEL